MNTVPVGIQLGINGMAHTARWQEIEPVIPEVAAVMRRYVEQISCVLRPGSVAALTWRCVRSRPT